MKTTRKVLSILLAALMLATTFVVCLVPPAAAEVGTSYQKGDVIEFGTYPQTKVTDEVQIVTYDNFLKSYFGSNDAIPSSVDFYYDGIKYRGVKWYGHYIRDYYKYEPLRWTVLNPLTGFCLCEKVIDFQSFHNKNNGNYPYDNSLLKQWMESDFYHTMIGGNYSLSEVEECTLLSMDDLRIDYRHVKEDLISSILWDCGATDYAEDYGWKYTSGWWTNSVEEEYPVFNTDGTVYYSGWSDEPSNFSNVNFHYPFYFYSHSNNYYQAIENAIEDGYFLTDLNCLVEDGCGEIDYQEKVGLFFPSYKTETHWHWTHPCRNKSVPVGNYTISRGIRPVLKLKKLAPDTGDNGYLLSSGTKANTVVVDTVGEGAVSGTGLKTAAVTGRRYTYLMNGQSVTLTATPNSGYSFDGWYKYSSDGYTKVSSDASYTVTAQNSGYYKAQFKQTTQVKMFVKGFSTGSGYMTCNKQSMAVGESALFNAYPDHDSYFTGWYGGLDQGNGWYGNFQKLSDSPQYANLTLEFSNEAFFAEFQRATLIEKISITGGRPNIGKTVSTAGPDKLTIEDGADDFTINSIRWLRINSDGTATQMASNETFVRGGNYLLMMYLKKTSDASHKLIPDEVEVLLNHDPNCTKPVAAGPSTYAIEYRYMNLQQYTLRKIAIGDGTGTINGSAAAIKAPGSEVELSATPAEGSCFAGWYYKNDGTQPTENDVCYSTDEETTFRMPEHDTIIAAVFKEIPPDCVVNVQALSNIGGLVSGGGSFTPGTPITITATPDEGYTFDGWYNEGNLFSTENPCELDVPVMESITLEAKFTKTTQPDNPQPDPNMCHWCGKVHTGFFQSIIGFFHNIFAKIFGNKY